MYSVIYSLDSNMYRGIFFYCFLPLLARGGIYSILFDFPQSWVYLLSLDLNLLVVFSVILGINIGYLLLSGIFEGVISYRYN